MNMRARSGRSTHRPGQALVEFALIAPILLLLIMGLVDFARAWSAHHAVADAAREGARMLAVYDPAIQAADAEAAILDRLLSARLDAAAPEHITFDPVTGEPDDKGEPVTVTINYPFDLWVLGPFMGWATGDQRVNLVSTITMRSE